MFYDLTHLGIYQTCVNVWNFAFNLPFIDRILSVEIHHALLKKLKHYLLNNAMNKLIYFSSLMKVYFMF